MYLCTSNAVLFQTYSHIHICSFILFIFNAKKKKNNESPQSVYNRNKMLLEKAQDESDGPNHGKTSLKATLTEQIKEQETICLSLKEVRTLLCAHPDNPPIFGV